MSARDSVPDSFAFSCSFANSRWRLSSSVVNTLSSIPPSGLKLSLSPEANPDALLDINPLATFAIPCAFFLTGSLSVSNPTSLPILFKNVSFSPVRVIPFALNNSSFAWSCILEPSACNLGLFDCTILSARPTILPIAFSNSLMFLVWSFVISSTIFLIKSS